MFDSARKWFAYHANESVSSEAVRHVKEIGVVWELHQVELKQFWRLTGPDEQLLLEATFFEELKREWPREFSELAPVHAVGAISEGFKNSINLAYTVGCMLGNGWVSEEQMADFNLYLGDKLVYSIRSVSKNSKAKGVAFATAFAAVAVRGHLKVIQ